MRVGGTFMLIAIFPVILAIVGVLMWALAANPKLAEIGKIMFFCGLFVTTWQAASWNIKIG